jgi:hypothetical protein
MGRMPPLTSSFRVFSDGHELAAKELPMQVANGTRHTPRRARDLPADEHCSLWKALPRWECLHCGYDPQLTFGLAVESLPITVRMG